MRYINSLLTLTLTLTLATKDADFGDKLTPFPASIVAEFESPVWTGLKSTPVINTNEQPVADAYTIDVSHSRKFVCLSVDQTDRARWRGRQQSSGGTDGSLTLRTVI